MLTIYSDEHHLHYGQSELNDGELMPCFECPARADNVLAAVRELGIGDIVAPRDFGRDPLARVHSEAFLSFLENAWPMWQAEGRDCDALPLIWPVRGLRQVEPPGIDGKLGFFSMDAGTPITAGTWQAVTTGANVCLTGAASLVDGERSAFALSRPPGHHASSDCMGGYCYLNNAAIAAQFLRDNGAGHIAIVDVDYHHGNGTQSIFYERDDVLFLSIHADPVQEFPYFLGFADETGAGAGRGFNGNYPLPWGTEAPAWFAALDDCLARVASYAPDAVVVSLGVDTFKEDPISQFRLQHADYLKIGESFAQSGRPVLFILEGGYAVDDIGINVTNVLQGFYDHA